MTPNGTKIALADVTVAHNGKVALQRLSVEGVVHRTGVVGRNGSGKSTLARVLAGLVTPDQGTVRINDCDVARDRRGALREVGILFQNPDHQIIFPTVLEEMAFGLTQQGRKRKAAEALARDVLARFGKAHWENVGTNALSQGQKHLVCLMAIVAMGPRLLILDEPFAGLDIPTRAQLVRALAMYDGNILHISHDPDDLAHCDRLLWLDQGRIRADGGHEVMTDYVAEMHRLGGEDDLSDITG